MIFRRRKLLKEKISKLEKEIEEKNNIIAKIIADFESYKLMAKKEIENEKERILLKFIEIYENLEIACNEIKDDGLLMILDKFKKLLKEEGIEEIETIGKKFDYNLHYAIKVENKGEKGIIIEEIKKGYKMNGKVIRPAYVVVSGEIDESYRD